MSAFSAGDSVMGTVTVSNSDIGVPQESMLRFLLFLFQAKGV